MAPDAQPFRRSLFVFRRDLRTEDNTALLEACRRSERVTACFILDPRQTREHAYRSLHALRFMADSLEELEAAVTSLGGALSVLTGEAEGVISSLLASERFDAVFFHRDYTPFALRRDEAIRAACAAAKAQCVVIGDALLHEPEEVSKDDGTPYTVFTPFWKRASRLPVRSPAGPPPRVLEDVMLPGADADWRRTLGDLPAIGVTAGRAGAVSALAAVGTLDDYAATRDIPSAEGTTRLSAHLKFGTCSVREAMAAAKGSPSGADIARQLHWRDFFTHVAFHAPRVFGHAFQERYDAITWSTDEDALRRWQEGTTGFPIVDAGMRELAATGFMHNRARMICASFLVKQLHLDWRLGERWFARQLTDYDPAVNNGNWQWAASTGCDAVPYFRVFNPWIQQKKFDPDCAYVKAWIPELRDVPAAAIHAWHKAQDAGASYPAPMLEHAREAEASKAMFARAGR